VAEALADIPPPQPNIYKYSFLWYAIFMLEHLEAYSGLPKTVGEIPVPETVRSLPYIRFVADALCDNPEDKEELQKVLWRLDAMATGNVCDLYNQYHERLAANSDKAPESK
jgi:hypothetical protein